MKIWMSKSMENIKLAGAFFEAKLAIGDIQAHLEGRDDIDICQALNELAKSMNILSRRSYQFKHIHDNKVNLKLTKIERMIFFVEMDHREFFSDVVDGLLVYKIKEQIK